MKLLSDERALMERLEQDVQESAGRSLKVLAGHCPLLYHEESRTVELGVQRWGEFSPYTFDLGCRLASYAKRRGNPAQVLVLVDDDCEQQREVTVRRARTLLVRRDFMWAKSRRHRLLKAGELPEEYSQTLDRYGLTVEDLVHQNRKGTQTPLVSEKLLKATARRLGFSASNECAIAYKGLIFDPSMFDIETDYLVSFIPDQCKGSICTGILDQETGLHASHAFFPDAEVMGMGLPMWRAYASENVLYRKSPS